MHENDHRGLENLCRYGARGALSLERLSLREDGSLAYRMKRPAPDGSTHLLLTSYRLPWAELLRRSFAVDVLSCHRCGSPRRVLAFISSLSAAHRVLRHLHLPASPPELPCPTGPPHLCFEPLPAS